MLRRKSIASVALGAFRDNGALHSPGRLDQFGEGFKASEIFGSTMVDGTRPPEA